MPATIISLINQKGGCGKSSTCFHLSGSFSLAGFRVLIVDADPQGSLGQAFFGSVQVEQLSAAETLTAIFDDAGFCSRPWELAVETQFNGISIVRANQTLAPHNTPQPELSGLRQGIMRDFLRHLDGYDLILIDCPPNLYQSSWNALVAADFVLIPVPPEDFGTQGLRVVHQAIEQARILNPKLNLLGHLITRCDHRLLIHRTYEDKLRKKYGDSVLQTVIPEASAFKVSLTCRQPVNHHAPISRAAITTSLLATEILERVARATAERRVA